MNIGMLWFDNDPRVGLELKVARAADYYCTKYGRKPDLCFVHPSMLAALAAKPVPAEAVAEVDAPAERLLAGEVELRSTRTVLPNHLWIGVNG